jgi:hypothetical protein
MVDVIADIIVVGSGNCKNRFSPNAYSLKISRSMTSILGLHLHHGWLLLNGLLLLMWEHLKIKVTVVHHVYASGPDVDEGSETLRWGCRCI